MIKGARKEMIVVRTGNSRYFDEAYFVLRDDAQKNTQKGTSILDEANRILDEITPEFSSVSKKKNRGWLLFALGSICGIILGIFITLLLV